MLNAKDDVTAVGAILQILEIIHSAGVLLAVLRITGSGFCWAYIY